MRRIGRWALGLIGGEQGIAAVEFALMTAALLPLFLLVVDFTQSSSTAQQIVTAAQAGASWCVRNGTSKCTAAAVQPVVQTGAQPLVVSAGNISVLVQTGCASGNSISYGVSSCAGYASAPQYVTVTVSYTFVPLIWPASIVLTRTAVARLT
jgi:Flp pilus assembly protein TadG